MATRKKTTCKFPGRFENLEKISIFIIEAAELAGFDDEEVYSIQLAADEAASNIIEHAYGGEDRGDIECTCEVNSSGLTITFKDEGEPFNPDQVPDLELGLPIEERKPGGAGLYLMRKLMDEVDFKFSPTGQNILILVKRKSN